MNFNKNITVILFILTFIFSTSLLSFASDVESTESVLNSAVHQKEDISNVGHGHINLGEILPIASCIPFAFMLLSIAFLPLIAPSFWHHHFGKISVLWALVLGVPFIFIFKQDAVYELFHIIIADYIPFIVLLWSLYTVSGGILLRGSLRGTPIVNTIILMIGIGLASWMGTTGAAMLLIRPLIRANNYRKNKTFIVVFFIFLVANIGGSLTPLGDPPLFLGFLHGVNFLWTFNIFFQMVTVSLILIVIYFIMDTYYYRKEKITAFKEEKIPLKLEGTYNFLFLAGIVGAVLASGLFDLGEVNTFGVHRAALDWIRDGSLILLGFFSLLVTPRNLREDNEFTWFPIIEVASLFIGIFITMVPCLLILKAGEKGALAFLIEAVKEPYHYFWVTGILSAFLDNAPTYLTFFNTALGSFYANMPESEAVKLLMTDKAIYLKAISTGAVFFGACSYIGNAPNFMVKSIAEASGVKMPGFFGYILKYSLVLLIPCFLIVTFIFF
ncbi:MAG: sodium:proton antiporter [Deltaproteobacteria bacterium]|nr:sodium:proton antiporter [Deltaproteobacteria bacterium]